MNKFKKLTSPVVIDKFWKNRGGEAVLTELREFQGHVVVDVRVYFTDRGVLVPTTKGISIAVLRLPDLARAIDKAISKARELGLIAYEAST